MHHFFASLILLAKHSSTEAASAPAGKSVSACFAIVIFFLLLGLAVTLTPPKRTFEVKRPKDE